MSACCDKFPMCKCALNKLSAMDRMEKEAVMLAAGGTVVPAVRSPGKIGAGTRDRMREAYAKVTKALTIRYRPFGRSNYQAHQGWREMARRRGEIGWQAKQRGRVRVDAVIAWFIVVFIAGLLVWLIGFGRLINE